MHEDLKTKNKKEGAEGKMSEGFKIQNKRKEKGDKDARKFQNQEHEEEE